MSLGPLQAGPTLIGVSLLILQAGQRYDILPLMICRIGRLESDTAKRFQRLPTKKSARPDAQDIGGRAIFETVAARSGECYQHSHDADSEVYRTVTLHHMASLPHDGDSHGNAIRQSSVNLPT